MYRFLYFSVLPLLLFCSCGKKGPSVNSASSPRPVKVVKVEALGSINKHYTGVVEAHQFSILAFKIPGTLTELNVQAGQQIRKGDVIARVKPFDYQKQYQSAQANFTTAKSIYERNQRLFASGAVARQNLEIAEADYVQATSALNIAKRTLEYTTLTAPFSGFIERRFVENYEEVLPGQAIVRLVNPENIEIDFILPETSIQLLQVPKKIFVEFDTEKGSLFTSEIKEYVYSSNGSGIPVTLNITDKQFTPYRKNVFPGFSCRVTFVLDNMISDKFVIPASALLQENNQNYVWIVNPETHTTQRRPVKIVNYKDQAFVEQGLNSDDLIVIAGVSAIKEGQKVSLMD